jgi:hypothetical protein
MTGDVTGKIAAILSPSKVVINKGSKDGVESGDFFVIYSELGPFSDPDTKQDLGSTRQIWGKVRVSLIEKRFCIAETETRLRNPFIDSTVLAAIFGSQQVRLPVNEGQMWKGVEKVEVGFPVILLKAPESSEEEEAEREELISVQPSLLPPAPTDDRQESEP